ncbi:MAG: carboxymuconolactone decarboxylase family protein [Alphaproteobacteria bacterium]|nr:carboxymuconolactone decarboxylase family protein [Alphaproteobacteria bacterium]
MQISSKPISAYPWLIRMFFWKQKRTYGEVLEPGLLWARSPWVFAALALLYGALNRRTSPLDPALRSLVTVRISQINHCAFCVDINAATLEKRGVCPDKILALNEWQSSPMFEPVERAALMFAEAVTHTDAEVTGIMRKNLTAHFSEDEITELTGLIAFQNMSSKFNAALDVAPQGFCHVPHLQSDET